MAKKEEVERSLQIRDEFLTKFLVHYKEEGVPCTMTAVTEFVIGVFKFGAFRDKRAKTSKYGSFNQLFVDGLNFGLTEFELKIINTHQDIRVEKILTPDDLNDEESAKIAYKINSALTNVFSEYFTKASPELALSGVTAFFAKLLLSTKDTDEELLQVFVNSLNVFMAEDGVEVIIVSKD